MITFAAIGLDHRHIYEQVGRLLALGCTCKGFWTEGEPQPLAGFIERYPDIERINDRRHLLDDPEIQLIVTAAIPADRAAIAIEAMQAGKDVMTDKPGCTSRDDFTDIERVAAETGRIWSINFSERFEVPAVGKAAALIEAGHIGEVVQTLGTGPHRLNKHLRPDWFFDPARYGGILTDIASHQIDQFLYFTGSSDAEITTATVANYANPQTPGLEDFGELVLRSENGHGYIRVDWYTPDGLPTWGDGRLKILGTEGYIELRKYVDIAGRSGTDHLYLVTGNKVEYIDCSSDARPYYRHLVDDIRDRTETAMPQSHCFKVMELALEAQAKAVRLGYLR